jgi:hypothetical protein
MLYIYAITDSATPPDCAGLDGAPLRTVGDEAPFALVSEHEDLSRQMNEDDLWEHERVVENLMQVATALPMRFDGSVEDEESLRRILAERRDEFLALLEEVRGAVELGVRALLPAVPATAAATTVSEAGSGSGGTGTAYLLARAERERAVADLTARVHEPLADVARRSAEGGSGLARTSFKAAYLVDRDRVDEFRARVEKLESEIVDAQIVCTGPWPPYSFSSLEKR